MFEIRMMEMDGRSSPDAGSGSGFAGTAASSGYGLVASKSRVNWPAGTNAPVILSSMKIMVRSVIASGADGGFPGIMDGRKK